MKKLLSVIFTTVIIYGFEKASLQEKQRQNATDVSGHKVVVSLEQSDAYSKKTVVNIAL